MEEDFKFKGKYRTESNRNTEWDYSDDGYYFITICTKEKQEFFGKIRDGEMVLNKIGKLVLKDILNLPSLHENIEIDEFVIMPNHVHMIIVINRAGRDVSEKRLYNDEFNSNFSKISPKKGSLGNIVKLFKGFLTKKINQKHPTDPFEFSWQANYHDRIIRNEKELFNTRKYIQENPQKWELDEYYKK